MAVTWEGMKTQNKAIGHCWFSADTMRWWKTRLLYSSLVDGPGGVYFVTSDVLGSSGRLYTVRHFEKTGQVGTAHDANGDPLRFRSAATAKRWARSLARV